MANKTILTRCPNWPHGCKAVFTGVEMNRGKMARHVRDCKTLMMIAAAGDALTPRQREILSIMDRDKEDLVCEGPGCWVGLTRVSKLSVLALLQACAISMDSFEGKLERYHINGTGRALVRECRKAPKKGTK